MDISRATISRPGTAVIAAGAVVGIGTQALAAAAWPGYDPLARTISSLGTAASPWHALVNAGFVINALALAGGGIVLVVAGRGPVRAGSVLIAMAGALGLLVAAVPEDANLALHSIGALNLPLASIGLVVIGAGLLRGGRPRLGATAVAAGVLGLVGTVLFVAIQAGAPLGAYPGLVERAISYPAKVWFVVAALAGGRD